MMINVQAVSPAAMCIRQMLAKDNAYRKPLRILGEKKA
jgi:hypothetical protein